LSNFILLHDGSQQPLAHRLAIAWLLCDKTVILSLTNWPTDQLLNHKEHKGKEAVLPSAVCSGRTVVEWPQSGR